MKVVTSAPGFEKLCVVVSETIHKPVMSMTKTAQREAHIGDVIVNVDGVVYSKNRDSLTAISNRLLELGWVGESNVDDNLEQYRIKETSFPYTMSIAIGPRSCDQIHTAKAIRNLVRILYTNQYIICRMIKTDSLYVGPSLVRDVGTDRDIMTVEMIESYMAAAEERGDLNGVHYDVNTGITLSMPHDPDSMYKWEDYVELMHFILVAAFKNKLYKAEWKEPDNERFFGHNFLTRINVRGDKYKPMRKRLLSHLPGYASFPSAEKAAEYRARKAAENAHDLGANERTDTDD